jgi:hypothetical protein
MQQWIVHLCNRDGGIFRSVKVPGEDQRAALDAAAAAFKPRLTITERRPGRADLSDGRYLSPSRVWS